MRKIISVVFGLLMFVALTKSAYAFVVINGNGMWGDFSAKLNYTVNSSTAATLQIDLANESLASNGGYITAFVFNNPDNLIDLNKTSLISSNTNFQLLADNNDINAAPYGYFDLGASIFKSFEGGKKPQNGIAAGDNATFTFSFTGSNLDELNEMSFLSELSTGTGAGQGYESFVVRFRGFENDESDKVPGDKNDHSNPEPASIVLLSIGLLGLGSRKLRKN